MSESKMPEFKTLIRYFVLPTADSNAQEYIHSKIFNEIGYRLPMSTCARHCGSLTNGTDRRDILTRVYKEWKKYEYRQSFERQFRERYTRCQSVHSQSGVYEYFDIDTGNTLDPVEYGKRYKDYLINGACQVDNLMLTGTELMKRSKCVHIDTIANPLGLCSSNNSLIVDLSEMRDSPAASKTPPQNQLSPYKRKLSNIFGGSGNLANNDELASKCRRLSDFPNISHHFENFDINGVRIINAI